MNRMILNSNSIKNFDFFFVHQVSYKMFLVITNNLVLIVIICLTLTIEICVNFDVYLIEIVIYISYNYFYFFIKMLLHTYVIYNYSIYVSCATLNL